MAITFLALFALTASSAAAAEPLDVRAALDALPTKGGWVELTRSADGAVAGTALQQVFPARAGHPAWGIVGPRSVTLAWGGGAYDPKRRLLVVAGGGHADYGGNEVYAFSVDSLRWQRLTEPSRYEPDFSTVDGTPVSRHSYDGIEYLAAVDRIVMFGGSLYRDGAPRDLHAWFFDVDRRAWERRAPAPASGYVGAAHDAGGGVYYARNATRLLAYDAIKDSWSAAGASAHVHDSTLEFDPLTRRLVFLLKGATCYFDLNLPGVAPMQRAKATGDTGIEAYPKAGLAFDPVSSRILAWPGERAVWSLEAASMRWRKLENPEGPAPERWIADRDGSRRDKTRGIYGRWRYMPHLDAFIGVVAAEDNVWLYRPPRARR